MDQTTIPAPHDVRQRLRWFGSRPLVEIRLLSHGTAASETLHGVAVRCELSGSQLIFERFERMLRTILTTSTP